MKISVTFVGSIRPSIDQIMSNLEININYFENIFDDVEFIILTYKNDKSISLWAKLREYTFFMRKNIKFIQIDPIVKSLSDSNLFINTYRMFTSVHLALGHVSIHSDYIIRVRLDCEIVNFQFRELEDNVYCSQYYIKGITDNIGYAKSKVMHEIWNEENIGELENNNEYMLKKIVVSKGYFIETFQFEFKLYQSPDKFWDGIPQWSKRNRKFISYLKEIINEDGSIEKKEKLETIDL